MPPITSTPTGIVLRVRVQPRASRTDVVGLHGEALKVRLTAPPVDGAANEALIRFLAERLGIARAGVRVVSGAGGRLKVVEVTGVGPDEAWRRLGLAESWCPG
jgi:uncharacterized protein (TIGR00251 family)